MVPRTAAALRALDGEREPDVTPAAHPVAVATHPPPLPPPPPAGTEGRRIENFNKTGVRLWTPAS
jgi:hypothetical protein